MKVVILCGGKGLRMKGISDGVPKALIKVDEKPIIWHIMNLYSHYDHCDFILPLGYKGEQIKQYFIDQYWKDNNFVFNIGENKFELLDKPLHWNITFVDTGQETMTGARIKHIETFINEDTFLLTYGDGLANIDLDALLQFHKEKGKLVTLTGIKIKSQYGRLSVKDGIATVFEEKQMLDEIINGGFFVCNKAFFRYLSNDTNCVLEEEALSNIVKDGELAVFEHQGYWIGIDTHKDLIDANEKWKEFAHYGKNTK